MEHVAQATYSKETADTRIRPSKRVISGREIVQDLRSGMTRRELMLKHGRSGAQLKTAFEIVLEQRRKVALKISEDVRSGMTSTELTEKYQLSNSGLQNVCQKLLSEGFLETANIERLNSALDNGRSLHNERRQIPGRFPEKAKAARAKRQVKPAEFLSDVRAGLDDAGLMQKYRISAHEVLKVMSKLIWRGLMSPTELHMRRSLAKTVYLPIFKCPSCNEITYEKLEKCPHCGVAKKNLNEKKSQCAL